VGRLRAIRDQSDNSSAGAALFDGRVISASRRSWADHMRVRDAQPGQRELCAGPADSARCPARTARRPAPGKGTMCVGPCDLRDIVRRSRPTRVRGEVGQSAIDRLDPLRYLYRTMRTPSTPADARVREVAAAAAVIPMQSDWPHDACVSPASRGRRPRGDVAAQSPCWRVRRSRRRPAAVRTLAECPASRSAMGRFWAETVRRAPATRLALAGVSQMRPSSGFGDMRILPSARRTLSWGVQLPLRAIAARRCLRAQPSKDGSRQEGAASYPTNYPTNYPSGQRRIRGCITSVSLADAISLAVQGQSAAMGADSSSQLKKREIGMCVRGGPQWRGWREVAASARVAAVWPTPLAVRHPARSPAPGLSRPRSATRTPSASARRRR